MLALLLALSWALPSACARVRGDVDLHAFLRDATVEDLVALKRRGIVKNIREKTQEREALKDEFWAKDDPSDAATASSSDSRNASDFDPTPHCVVDIVMTVNYHEYRIPAYRYREGEVFALTKTLTDGSDASYYVGCKVGLRGIPMTYLRVKKTCDQKDCYSWGKPWKTDEVRQFWFDKSRNAISKADKDSVATVALNDEFLLPPFAGRHLQTDVTLSPWRFNTCEFMPKGGCYAGCCGRGLACAEGVEGEGRCVPRAFDPVHVCKSDTNLKCRLLVREWEHLEQWALVVASSGGGGHIAAARNLVAKWSKEWSQRAAKYKERFERRAAQLVRGLAHEEMAEALEQALRRGPPIKQLDIMETSCFDVFGIHVGGFARKQWDNAQLAGDLDKLRELIKQQWLTPWVFGHQCTKYFAKVFAGEELPFRGSPAEVISTQPLLLHSISKAMQATEQRLSKSFALDVYMTDLPTEASEHFFNQLKKGVMWNKEASTYIRLHSVPPVDKNPRAKLASLAGLPEDQIIIEDFMPVNMEFTEPTGAMPSPGMEAELALKAQLVEEQRFLSDLTGETVGAGQQATISIGLADRMLLVMLGSQPTVQAMHKYLETSLHLPETSGLNWIFLACGKPSIPDYAELYKAVVALAAEFNAKARDSGRRLQIVPFTGQPAQHVLSRADATLTRSGGLTSGELLALAHRGDEKDVLLHVEVPEGLEAEPPSGGEEETIADDAREDRGEGDGGIRGRIRRSDSGTEPSVKGPQRQAWESEVLEGGMVPWEAGNARHLMGAVHARIVTPAMDFSKLLSF